MEAAKLLVTISADIDNLSRGLDQAAKDLKSSFLPAGIGAELIAEGITRVADSLMGVASGAIDGLMQAERASAQTAAAIKSTGGAAGVTVDQVAGLADTLERMTGVEAEVVQGGANMLLTFTNVKNRVGEGNDIFNQATKTALDMSVALGVDASNSAMQLGKALNDPTKGVSALQRVGVTFTESQKEQIKTLQESGRTMEAQKIILKELQGEFGGSALAAGNTFAGALKKLENSFGAVTESILQGTIPGMTALATVAAETFYKLSDAINDKGLVNGLLSLFGPEMKAMILGIGTAVTVAVIPAMINWGRAAAASAAASMAAWGPFLALAGAIAFAATPIIKYWDDLAFEFGLAFDFIGGKVKSFVDFVKTGFQHIANNIVGPVIRFITEKLAGLWSALPTAAKDALKGVGMAFGDAANNIVAPIKLVGVAAMETGKFVGANFRESFSGFGAALQAGAKMAQQFTASTTADMSKLTAGVTPHLAGVTDKVAGVGKAAKQSADEAKKNAEEIAKTFKDLPAKIKAVDFMANLKNDPVEALKAKVKILEGSFKELIERGVAPTDKRMLGLVDTFKKYSAALEDAKAKAKAAAEAAKILADRSAATQSLAGDLDEIASKAEVFGSTVNVASEQARAYEKALDALRKTGMKPTDQAMADLIEKWKAALKAGKEFKEHTFDANALLKEMADDLTRVDNRAAVFGKTIDVSAEKTRILENNLTRLIDEGFAPTSDEVVKLKAQLDALKPPQDATTAGIRTFRTALGTASGGVTALRDNLMTIMQPLGVALPAALFEAVDRSAAFVESGFKMGDALMAIGPNVTGLITQMSGLWTAASAMIPVLTGMAAVAWEAVVPAIVGIGSAIYGALGPVGLIAAGIAGLVLAGFWLVENWEKVSTWLAGVWDTIAGGARTVFGGVASAISGIWDGVVSGMRAALNGIIGFMNFVIRGLNRLSFTVPDWVPGIGGKSWGLSFAEVPYLAKGGLATGPTMAMIGEGADKEAVLPLNAGVFSSLAHGIVDALPGGGAGGGGGDTYIEITVQGQNDPEATARQMVKLLRMKGVTV